MNKLQETLYTMLQEIDDLCKKIDVKYILAGGTALGAVRNHKFLPWDDDIDLYITRGNWEKLKNAIENNPELIPVRRDFVYSDNTKYYCNPIIRYVNQDTTSIMASQILPAKACGQAIEFLVMYPIPNEGEKREKFIQMKNVYTQLLSPYFVLNNVNTTSKEYKKHLNLYRKYELKSRVLGKEKVLKDIVDDYLTFDESECDEYCMLWGIDTLIYRKADMQSGRTELFETEKYPVGKNAEAIFRRAYGDSWMYIPKVDDQVIHVSDKDLETSFQKYTDEYLTYIDREKYIRAYQKNKNNLLISYYCEKSANEKYAEVKSLVAERHINCTIVPQREELQMLLKNREYELLNERLSFYISSQMDPIVRKSEKLINVPDWLIQLTINNFVNQGRYYESNRIVNLLIKNNHPMSKELEESVKFVDLCRALSISKYDNNDINEVEQILEKIKKLDSNHIDYVKGELWLLEKKATSRDDWEFLEKRAAKSEQDYPFDGEIIALKAEAMYRLNKIEDSKREFARAVDNTRNAFVWDRANVLFGINGFEKEA